MVYSLQSVWCVSNALRVAGIDSRRDLKNKCPLTG